MTGADEQPDASFKATHAQFLDRLPRLLAVCDQFFVRSMKGADRLDLLVHGLGRVCIEDFREILTLARYGHGVGGLKILRGMYERAVTAWYLKANPDEVDLFLDYYYVSLAKLIAPLESNEAFSKGREVEIMDIKAKSDERRAKYMIACSRNRDCIRLNHTWSRLDFVSMAKTTPIGMFVFPAYLVPTKHIHSTVESILWRVDSYDDGITFRTHSAPEADAALVTAHNLVLQVLRLQHEHFQEEWMGRAINDLASDFQETWGDVEKRGSRSPAESM